MQIVPSLALCTQLKELGYPQEDTVFVVVDGERLLRESYERYSQWAKDVIAAPTVEEMLEWLRSELVKRKISVLDPPTFEIELDMGHVHIRQLFTNTMPIWTADTLSNACAKAVIWVLEKK